MAMRGGTRSGDFVAELDVWALQETPETQVGELSAEARDKTVLDVKRELKLANLYIQMVHARLDGRNRSMANSLMKTFQKATSMNFAGMNNKSTQASTPHKITTTNTVNENIVNKNTHASSPASPRRTTATAGFAVASAVATTVVNENIVNKNTHASSPASPRRTTATAGFAVASAVATTVVNVVTTAATAFANVLPAGVYTNKNTTIVVATDEADTTKKQRRDELDTSLQPPAAKRARPTLAPAPAHDIRSPCIEFCCLCIENGAMPPDLYKGTIPTMVMHHKKWKSNAVFHAVPKATVSEHQTTAAEHVKMSLRSHSEDRPVFPRSPRPATSIRRFIRCGSPD